MKIIIAGSRNFNNYDLLREKCSHLFQNLESAEIVSGTANGADKTALGWGAKWGQGNGLQGKTYGIPSKDANVRLTLSINEIKTFVDEFITFAKANSNMTFLVTEIGCGLAGLKPKDVAPLFKEAVELSNVHLPERFWHKLLN